MTTSTKARNSLTSLFKQVIVIINGSLITLNNSESDPSDLCGWAFVMSSTFKKVQYCNIIHHIPRVPSKADNHRKRHILIYSTAEMLNMSGHIKPDPVKFWHRPSIGTNNISATPFP